jgi:hypothetical protein
MNIPAIFSSRLLSRRPPLEQIPAQGGDALHLQEQFSGPVPLRGERSAAEVLRERLDESDPAGIAQVFVP